MGQRVLVADDSRLMRKIISRTLADIGITDISEAADGVEAMAAFGSGTFDLVLTDWNMPNKTGLDVLKEIRAMGSNVPVIMITTENEERRIKEALDAGVTDYLAKPFDSVGIREKVEKYLPATS